MSTNTPTGENGKKELKVTQSNDVDKLLDKYFEDLKAEGYDKIDIRALVFDVPQVAIKGKGGDENEQSPNFVEAINVLESGKRDFVQEEIAKGAGLNIKLADLKKVKAKADKLRKEKAEEKLEESKKSSSGTEKDRE